MTYRSGEGYSFNVLYTGPALVGVSTSLRVLVPARDSRPEFRTYHDRQSAERGLWFGEGESRRFVRLFSDYRGPIHVPPIGEGVYSENAWVRDECDRMRLLLPSIHGVVFVADSQSWRAESNLDELGCTMGNFRWVGRDAAEIPFVFQLNKRDLATSGSLVRVFNDPNPGDVRSVPNKVLSADELRLLLSTPRCAYVESVASRGHGVREALAALVRLVGR